MLAGATTFGALNYRASDDVAAEIVSAHIRALMAPQPIDVASSDHHTVKPWFNGKLAFAPTVVDLGAKGFPLVGGRIDVVKVAPVASLVYSHGKHLISLTEMSNTGGGPEPLKRHLEQGYLALSWSDAGVTYWAVSDAASNELENFAAAVPGRYGGSLITRELHWLSVGQACPLWVISGHNAMSASCPLYPRKRTFGG